MTLPTDRRKPRMSTGTITLIAVLIVGLVQLAGFIHSASASSKRNAQIKTLQTQLDNTQAQLSQALAALASDDAKLSDIRAGLDALAKQKHITPAEIRRLRHEARPRIVVSPTPGPTVTVTSSPKPTVKPSHTRQPHPTPTPGCTSIQVLGACPTIRPMPLPTLHLG